MEATALWHVPFAPHSAFCVHEMSTQLGHFWDFLQQKQTKQRTKLPVTEYSWCMTGRGPDGRLANWC